MCGPLTPKVSLRYIASQSEARVFSSAQTPGQSARISKRTSNRAKRHNSSHTPVDGSVDLSVTAVEIVLAVGTAGVVRVGAAGHAELVRVVAAHVLHGDAVFQCLAGKASLNVIDAATVGGDRGEPVNSS